MQYRKQLVVNIPKVVMPLIGINILVFILQNVFGASFTDLFVLNTATVFSTPWTLVTSMFLHGGFNHILFNMYALMMFGPLIERKIGSKKFLQMYFVSGILASLGFVLYSNMIVGTSALALGASGAIMGVLGMTIMLLPKMRVLFFFVIPMSMRTAGIIFAAVDLLGLIGIGGSGIANSAHLVGLAVGLLYAKYLLVENKKFYQEFAKPYNIRSTNKAHSKAIELSEQDVENYLKKGRL